MKKIDKITLVTVSISWINCLIFLALAFLLKKEVLSFPGLLSILLLIFLAGSILAVIAARRWVRRPLAALAAKAKRLLKEGSFPVPNGSFEESVSVLTQSLNETLRRERKYQGEIKQAELLFRALADFFDDVIYEYDLQAETVSRSQNRREKIPLKQFLRDMDAQELLHPEDKEIFSQYINRLRQGGIALTQDVRMKQPNDNRYVWTRICGTALLDDSGIPYKVIAKKMNVDREVREWESLIRKAQHDSLTGLYNPAAFTAHVSEAVQNDYYGKHALFVFDIDNFKSINDSMGHLYGDAVLSQISSCITEQFPAPVIVGRTGGDEFALFSPDARSREAIEAIAEKILEIFRRHTSPVKGGHPVTGSVGAAVFPIHGQKYSELFKHADDAMYCAKAEGKNRFVIYSDSVQEGQYLRRFEDAERESGDQIAFSENVSVYIFQILYESKDIETAVQMILDIVGRFYSVSRAYVFENSPDNRFCSNTFEWCGPDVSPEKEFLRSIPYTQLGNYSQNFDENGIFYCSDVEKVENFGARELLKKQNIHSVLQCAVRDGQSFRGFVGFDECTGNRLWTKDEISTLSFVAKILSTFLLRLRTETQLQEAYQIMQTALSHQNMLTYVVSFDNYKLLYINEPTRRMVPGAEVGDICYQRFMRRDTPCDFCPVRQLSPQQSEYTMEIYNEALDVWTNTTASKVQWIDGTTRCLLSCFDITGYKERLAALENAPE